MKDCSPEATKIFSRWTPNLSMELVKSREINSFMAAWFCTSGYRRVLSTRDASLNVYPGPTGEKIPKDLALAWLAISSDLKPTTRNWTRETLRNVDDKYDKGEEFFKRVKELYGSIEGYKSALREAMKKDVKR